MKKAFSDQELIEARQSIASTLAKCEKALAKLKEGTSQHTLTKRRVAAFILALDLVDEKLENIL